MLVPVTGALTRSVEHSSTEMQEWQLQVWIGDLATVVARLSHHQCITIHHRCWVQISGPVDSVIIVHWVDEVCAEEVTR